MNDTQARTPRTTTYRTAPASQPWHRDKDQPRDYRPRHLVRTYTMPRESVPAIRERHGREA